MISYTFIIYSIITFFLIFLAAKASYRLNLVDIPNSRKIHTKPTPYIGGIVIAFVYIISLKLFPKTDNNLDLLISVSFFMSIIGLIDDKYILNTGEKLSLQIIPIFYLIFIENNYISHLGDYGYFKIELYTLSKLFTLLCVFLLVNSFNYFDGIDGSLASLLISILCILLFFLNSTKIHLFIIIILLPIFIFTIFNFSLFRLPKVFLGDSGSLLFGFLVSFLLIFLANKEIMHPILIAWLVSIFVYEFLSITLVRLINKKNIFHPGKDHLHHILFYLTKSNLKTNLLLVSINTALFLIGLCSFYLINSFTSLVLFVIISIIFFIIRKKLFNKQIV
jgi:UDP-GlcNAc:undecaprenyl-phosphate GlcNAc-1-phosphate transferase